MLEALLLSLSCTLTTNLVEYKNSAYHSIKVITCPADKVPTKLPYTAPDAKEDIRIASLTMKLIDRNTVVITNEIEVERPWVAPIPLFMGIAQSKHNAKLAEELGKLLKK